MGVNRGDRLDYLVSLESDQAGFEEYAKAKYPPDDWRASEKVAMGDMNTTLVRTVGGRSIMIQHGIATPRPYSRLNTVIGTRGILTDYPFRVGWEDEPGKGVHAYFDDARAAAVREEFMHPLWRQAGKLAQEVGGHDGMDLIMDLRWAYCLQNGLPLDQDVYDLAAWCALGELTEKSVREGSTPQKVPDFTRGAWERRELLGIMSLDTTRMDVAKIRPLVVQRGQVRRDAESGRPAREGCFDHAPPPQGHGGGRAAGTDGQELLRGADRRTGCPLRRV